MNPSTGTLFATHFSATLLVVGGFQWLKKAKWFPLLKDGQKILNRAWSLVAAAFIQLGITYTYSATPTGGHTIVFTLPSYGAMAIGLFHWAAQFIYQETGYTVLNGLQAFQAGAAQLAQILQHIQSVTDQNAGKGNQAAVMVEPAK